MPAPPAVAAEPLASLKRFAELAHEAGLSLLPTPLVGHMSGENFGFPGQGARSLYSDGELIAWQKALVGAVVDTLSAAPSVIGWILSNEMPLWATPWGTPPGDPVAIEAWARALVTAVRDRDPRRPLSIGDGTMSHWPTRALAPVIDWIGPHIYYSDADPLRQALNTDFTLALYRPLGKPLMLEEFGASSTQSGEVEHAAYVRDAVLATLANGGAGALIWCANDFSVENAGLTPPYAHHAFELGFGLLRADGSEKPVCEELRALRRLLDTIDFSSLSRPRPAAAIVRPDYLDTRFPFSFEDQSALRRTLLQAYVLAAQAGITVDVVGEDDALDGYALLILPSLQKLRVPTWLKLEAAARAGATVYWSYYSGDHDFHQGAWCPNFERLTGLQHHLRYGCFDLPGQRFILKGQVALSLPTGETESAAPHTLSRLPVTPRAGAAVESLAVDDKGRLALAEHRLGRGRVLFLTHPVERYIATRADASTRGVHALYRLIADEAGLEPRYETRHPDVHSHVLGHGAGEIIVVQHRGWSASVDDASAIPREAELLYDRGNPAPNVFGPKGARVYLLK
jgi:endo-1,4-beta-mannosidase